jgi:ABC-type molybdate transport system substrate-binding protein
MQNDSQVLQIIMAGTIKSYIKTVKSEFKTNTNVEVKRLS